MRRPSASPSVITTKPARCSASAPPHRRRAPRLPRLLGTGLLLGCIAAPAEATVRDNDLYFGDPDGSSDIQRSGDTLFTVGSHRVSRDDVYEGTSNQGDHGIRVRAGRTSSPESATWLVQQGRAPYHDTGGVVPEPFDGSFFALIGDLRFSYKPNARSYLCSGVGLIQAGGTGAHRWAVVSNIEPGLAVMDRYAREPVRLSCVDQASRRKQKFKVSALGHSNFRIDIEPSSKDPTAGMSLEDLGDALSESFNAIEGTPVRDQLFSWGIYQVGGAWKFVLDNPRDFQFDRVESSARQNRLRPTSEKLLWNDTSELPNWTPLNQTISSTTHSLTVTDSVTTSTNVTLSGGLGGSGSFKIKAVQISVDLEAKYSHDSGEACTTQRSEQYTTPQENILVPPWCSAIVEQQLSQASFEGSYEFDLVLRGQAGADGTAFLYQTEHPVWAPMRYTEGTHRPGRVELYEVFSRGPDPSTLDPRLRLDQERRAVIFTGSGVFSGSAGAHYRMSVRFEPLMPNVQCGGPRSVERALRAPLPPRAGAAAWTPAPRSPG